MANLIQIAVIDNNTSYCVEVCSEPNFQWCYRLGKLYMNTLQFYRMEVEETFLRFSKMEAKIDS